MGHLTRVANALVQNAEKGPNAEQLGQLLKGEGRGQGRVGGSRGHRCLMPLSPLTGRAAGRAAGAVGGVRVGPPG